MAVLVVAGLGLAGCGDDETVTMPDGTKVSADSDGKSASIKTDEGTITVGKGLPEGFPSDDVPVVDGKVIGGAKGTEGGPYAWSVILQAEGSAEDVFTQISEKLKNAGFSSDEGMQMGSVYTGSFKGEKYEVSVNAAKVADGISVTYLVRDVA
ncbi:hypothetical protein EFK50_09615 [Nocardioides marmoriginsengisoli]|uniref:Uncharacterized protein n=1 Tax=Nocardioides marmoriginsengisoli TaxID=661483 RepID=A0A3N0CF36_9ACTN|nr:hypothetical protein [Nocardioides marmoriginsengisoli]RNL62070.1 hypothetical protein EFK50_09615 [Nocardioides marmoriginsengisoli]